MVTSPRVLFFALRIRHVSPRNKAANHVRVSLLIETSVAPIDGAYRTFVNKIRVLCLPFGISMGRSPLPMASKVCLSAASIACGEIALN
jgi:hypothetical protein